MGAKCLEYIRGLPEALRHMLVVWVLYAAIMLLLGVIAVFSGMGYEVYVAVFALASVCAWLAWRVYYFSSHGQCVVCEGIVVSLDYAAAIPKFSLKKGIYRGVKAVSIKLEGGHLLKARHPIKVRLETGMSLRLYVHKKSLEKAFVSHGVTHVSDILAYEVFGGGKDF